MLPRSPRVSDPPLASFPLFCLPKVEVSTPTFVAPEGLVFCLATPSVSLSSATFSVSTLVQGGTQFDRDGQTIVDDSGVDLGGVSFFQTKTAIWDQGALEFGTLYDVLANDDYFSSSYVRKRYDDLESKYNTSFHPPELSRARQTASSSPGAGKPTRGMLWSST